jgi:hypothetical protein
MRFPQARLSLFEVESRILPQTFHNQTREGVGLLVWLRCDRERRCLSPKKKDVASCMIDTVKW